MSVRKRENLCVLVCVCVCVCVCARARALVDARCLIGTCPGGAGWSRAGLLLFSLSHRAAAAAERSGDNRGDNRREESRTGETTGERRVEPGREPEDLSVGSRGAGPRLRRGHGAQQQLRPVEGCDRRCRFSADTVKLWSFFSTVYTREENNNDPYRVLLRDTPGTHRGHTGEPGTSTPGPETQGTFTSGPETQGTSTSGPETQGTSPRGQRRTRLDTSWGPGHT